MPRFNTFYPLKIVQSHVSCPVASLNLKISNTGMTSLTNKPAYELCNHMYHYSVRGTCVASARINDMCTDLYVAYLYLDTNVGRVHIFGFQSTQNRKYREEWCRGMEMV